MSRNTLYFKEIKGALKGKITTNYHHNVVSDLSKMVCSALNHMLSFLYGLYTFSLSDHWSSLVETARVMVSSHAEPGWISQNAAAPMKLAVPSLPKLSKSVIIKNNNWSPHHHKKPP